MECENIVCYYVVCSLQCTLHGKIRAKIRRAHGPHRGSQADNHIMIPNDMQNQNSREFCARVVFAVCAFWFLRKFPFEMRFVRCWLNVGRWMIISGIDLLWLCRFTVGIFFSFFFLYFDNDRTFAWIKRKIYWYEIVFNPIFCFFVFELVKRNGIGISAENESL